MRSLELFAGEVMPALKRAERSELSVHVAFCLSLSLRGFFSRLAIFQPSERAAFVVEAAHIRPLLPSEELYVVMRRAQLLGVTDERDANVPVACEA